MSGIQPRNLTARSAARVVGNPTSTRMESAVANCFPGLEWDVRELDRRFFPGLVFQFVSTPLRPVEGILPVQQGAKIAYLDSLDDPALPLRSDEPWVRRLLTTLQENIGQDNPLADGRWYLEWFEQHGKRFSMRDGADEPFDGELVWRMVRGIERDVPLAIAVQRRGDDGNRTGHEVVLDGYRRVFVDDAGVIDAAYKPGELTMSMCNPWSHDFRDCACHYWSSNHPDVVLGPSAGQLADGQPDDAEVASVRLDWLRSDRSAAGRVGALATIEENRPYQIDHFEMNRRWRDLPFVVEGREIDGVYRPRPPEQPERYDSIEDLVEALRTDLAPMELTLALRYLYAYFSVKSPDEVDVERWPRLVEDVSAIRQYVLLVAIAEMQHLRWANRILWELADSGGGKGGRRYEPVLHPLPTGHDSSTGTTAAEAIVPELAPLTLETLDEFIAIERPGGEIDTAYARAVGTLRGEQASPQLWELAMRIDADGNEHSTRFREIRRMIEVYPTGADAPYLRKVTVGTPATASEALDAYRALLTSLQTAYLHEASGGAEAGQRAIDAARETMDRLRSTADDLARRGVGVPFFDA